MWLLGEPAHQRQAAYFVKMTAHWRLPQDLNMRMFQVNVRKSGEHDDVWTKLQPFLVNGSLTKLLKSNTGETEKY